MSDWLLRKINEAGGRPFLATSSQKVSYQTLDQRTSELEEKFVDAGVKSGDVVTLLGDYSLDGIAALLALFKLKAIVAPVTSESEEEKTLRRTESNSRWEINTAGTTELKEFEVAGTRNAYVEALIEQKGPD